MSCHPRLCVPYQPSTTPLVTLINTQTLTHTLHPAPCALHPAGILPNLFTEISTSKEKNFQCVDLIDTPGLVDGDMQYPFDVIEAILWMAGGCGRLRQGGVWVAGEGHGAGRGGRDMCLRVKMSGGGDGVT